MGTRPPSRNAVDRLANASSTRSPHSGSRSPGRTGSRRTIDPNDVAGMLRADSGLADANATALSLRQNLKDCKTALNGLDDEVQRLAVEWEQHEQDATYYEQQSQKNRARATELLAKAEHQGLAAQSCMQQAEDCRAELEERLNSTAYDLHLSTAPWVDSGRKWVHLPRGGCRPGGWREVRLLEIRGGQLLFTTQGRQQLACPLTGVDGVRSDGTLLHKGWLGGDETRWRWTVLLNGEGVDATRLAELAFCCETQPAMRFWVRELSKAAAASRQPPPSPTAYQRRARPGAPPLPRGPRSPYADDDGYATRSPARAGSRNWGWRVGGGGAERERDRDGNVWSAATGRKSPSRFARTTSPFIDDEDDADGVSELIDVTVRNARNKPLGLNVRDGYVSHVAAGSPASHKLHVGDKIVSVDGKAFDRYTPFSPDLSAGEHHFRVQRSLKPPKDAGYGYFSS